MSDTGTAITNAIRGLAAPADLRHFAALGRLVSAYANAEASVHLIARHFSKLDDPKARAIFEGMRLSDLRGRVRRMMEIDAVAKEIAEDVLSCFAQLEVIRERRNQLVHQLVDYASGHMLVTNWLTAKSMAAAEIKFFTLDDLGRDDVGLPLNLPVVARCRCFG